MILWAITLLSSSVFYAQNPDLTYKMPTEKGRKGYQYYSEKDRGFWCATEALGATSVRINKKNYQYGSVDVIMGIRFSQFFKIGAGIGVGYYLNNSEIKESDTQFNFPVYGVLRGNFFSDSGRNSVPFWNIKVGWMINEDFLLNPSLGMRFGERRKAFTLSLGYMLQNVKLKSMQENSPVSMAALQIGYEF